MSGSLSLLEPPGPLQACNGIGLPYKPYLYYDQTLIGSYYQQHMKLEKMMRVTKSALRISTAGGTQLTQGFKQFFTY